MALCVIGTASRSAQNMISEQVLPLDIEAFKDQHIVDVVLEVMKAERTPPMRVLSPFKG